MRWRHTRALRRYVYTSPLRFVHTQYSEKEPPARPRLVRAGHGDADTVHARRGRRADDDDAGAGGRRQRRRRLFRTLLPLLASTTYLVYIRATY